MLKEGICIRLKSKNRERITCQYFQSNSKRKGDPNKWSLQVEEWSLDENGANVTKNVSYPL